MKRIIALGLIAIGSYPGLAQMKNVTKAETLLKDGNIAEAKELIDLATVNEKSLNKSKTWYIRGLVYEEIAVSMDPEVTGLDENASNDALDAYNKVLQMEKEGSPYYGTTILRIENMWVAFLNNGATKYQEDDFEGALKYFQLAQLIKPEDTTAILYTGAAAQSIEQFDLALENYYKLLELGNRPIDVYGSILSIEKIEKKDTVKALEIVRMALEEYPDSDQMRREEINLLILTNRLEDAMTKLQEAITNDPNNEQLYYSLGYMYDESGDQDKAIETYQKAIELKSDFFEANYNAAVLLYNKGAEKFKIANNLSIDEYRKNGDKIEEEGRVWFRVSLPYWLKASELSENDISTLENLQGTYIRLKMVDKAEEIMARIKALEGE